MKPQPVDLEDGYAPDTQRHDPDDLPPNRAEPQVWRRSTATDASSTKTG